MLAHQGGWDELAWFVVPVLAVLYLLRWAERRSRSARSDDVPEGDPGRDAGADGGQKSGEGTREDADSP